MTRPITIKELAKMAGVAPSTISRVVTNRPGVGKQTRERILNMLREENYQPNSVARSLVTQRLQTIGILVPRRGSAFFENPFFADVLMGALEIASEQNYDVLLYTGGREEGETFLQERKVDGVLAVGLREDDSFLSLLQAKDRKVVLMNRQAEDAASAWVSVDNRQGAKAAVSYLIEQGHTEIGFIQGSREVEASQLRLAGYRDALEAFDIPYRAELCVEGNFDEESGRRATQLLCSRKLSPTAIFAANDLMAIGALAAARELGISVPGELSLFGFDNIHSTQHTNPALCTVKIPALQMGQLACGLLLELLTGKKPHSEQILLPTELVIRNSVSKLGG